MSRPRVDVAAPQCKCGGAMPVFSTRYDALWCRACEQWTTPKCSDKRCEFCSQRPPTAAGQQVDEEEEST